MSERKPEPAQPVRPRKVTITQIAKEAGVSKTAVSFAFNDPAQLAPATVSHIREVAERLGYSPDPIARSMTTRRTNALGLLLPQDLATAMCNPFYAEFIRGVGGVCGRVGMTLMLVPPLWGSMLKAIPHATVDGFIVVGLEVDRGEVQQLRRRHVPFVMVDGEAPADVSSVNVDDCGGARAAMEHVLSYGHCRIAVLELESWHTRQEQFTGTLAARLEGYRAALAAHGRTLDDPDIRLVEAASSHEGGRVAFHQLWQPGWRPTAVVAMSDIAAIGVLEAARDAGLAVPGDLSIVGFDDLPEARYVRPALTTVHQPVAEKARLAAEALVVALSDAAHVTHYLLPTELVVRESVARPRD
ncbi:MAG TPA: LacI family DNA-binding transcriptional regulator [Roseiflexaceae bacterium]|nr:LacI family DNA-binding transcriptional regulator [Roseiflexaceae bacterium]